MGNRQQTVTGGLKDYDFTMLNDDNLIASGGCGRVYKIKRFSDKQLVAIKIITVD